MVILGIDALAARCSIRMDYFNKTMVFIIDEINVDMTIDGVWEESGYLASFDS